MIGSGLVVRGNTGAQVSPPKGSDLVGPGCGGFGSAVQTCSLRAKSLVRGGVSGTPSLVIKQRDSGREREKSEREGKEEKEEGRA